MTNEESREILSKVTLAYEIGKVTVTQKEINEALDMAIKALEPQMKRGKWIWELAPNGWANHICSECGFKENTDIHVKLNWKYCPKCGAEMRGDMDE